MCNVLFFFPVCFCISRFELLPCTYIFKSKLYRILLICFFVQYEVDLIKLMSLHVFMDLVHLLCLSLPCINDFTLDKELITVNLL